MVNGIIILYKPVNMSSAKATGYIKSRFSAEKCGHTGTLDPLAEGVLPVLLNKATKAIPYLGNEIKGYLVKCRLGLATDTFDMGGTIIAENSTYMPSMGEIKNVVSNYTGEVELDIPIYSAIKINGVRAYKLARQAQIDSCGKRLSNIHDLEIVNYKYPFLTLMVRCSKGTYIRSLVKHIGEDLKTYATVVNLIRVHDGKFSIEKSVKLEEIKTSKDPLQYVFRVEEFLDLPEAVVKDSAIKKISNGLSPMKFDYLYLPVDNKEICAIYDSSKRLLCIARKNNAFEEIPYKIEKVIV
jgi:tRNA pseudouridine55 synthase